MGVHVSLSWLTCPKILRQGGIKILRKVNRSCVQAGETRLRDVVTSGGQVIASSADLRDLGAKVDTVLCVIDREAGGPEKLAAEGLDLRPLFRMTDLTPS